MIILFKSEREVTTSNISRIKNPLKGTRFEKLRPAQEEVLKLYFSPEYKNCDVAIELPTGAGKTLIALLILEFWRNQNKKVAVLTGNKTLAAQFEAEAKDLGVPVTRFKGSGDSLPPKNLRDYRRAKAIGIMNYWVYINQNPSVDPADILVLDDAQLAEGAISSLYSVQISRYEHHTLYDALMKLIAQYYESGVIANYEKGLVDIGLGQGSQQGLSAVSSLGTGLLQVAQAAYQIGYGDTARAVLDFYVSLSILTEY